MLTRIVLLLFAAPVAAADFKSEPAELKIPPGMLKGTLVVPDGKGPFPVAVIHAGSGPTDRDCNQPIALKTDAFKLLVEGLAAKGIATLRYDKRAVGVSPRVNEEDLRLEQYADDLAAWIELVRKDSRFNRVAVIGHSECSTIGLMAAGKAKVDAFVSLCGPGERLGPTLRAQLKRGLPKEQYEAAEKAIAELEAGREVKDYPKDLAALFRPSVQPFLISLFKPDPAKLIAGVDVPVLVVNGSADLQIPAEHGKKLAAANPKAKAVVIDKMSHPLKLVEW